MKLYDGKIRLGGLTTNEVWKHGMTVAEIEVLRALHGADAVVDIAPSKPATTKRTSAEERSRLSQIYANSQSLTAVDSKKKAALLTELFGHERAPLPDELAAPAEAEAEPAFAA